MNGLTTIALLQTPFQFAYKSNEFTLDDVAFPVRHTPKPSNTPFKCVLHASLDLSSA